MNETLNLYKEACAAFGITWEESRQLGIELRALLEYRIPRRALSRGARDNVAKHLHLYVRQWYVQKTKTEALPNGGIKLSPTLILYPPIK